MNPLYLVPIFGILILIATDQLARRLAYRKMNTLYREHRFDELLSYLSSWYPRMFFPAYNRQYAIFNAYAQMGKIKEADEQLTVLLSEKKDDQQRCDLLILAFQFYLKHNKPKKAAKMLKRIQAEKTLAPVAEELTQLYEILAQKSSAYITSMERQLEGADPDTKHRLYYLLAQQCENKGDAAGVKRYKALDEELMAELRA